MGFAYTIEKVKGIGIIHPSGRLLEKFEAKDLLDEVNECISQGINRFVINFRKLEYINSSGLNVFINIFTRSRNAGGEAIICNVSPKLKNLFLLTRLDSVFQMTETRTEALKLLEKSAENHGS